MFSYGKYIILIKTRCEIRRTFRPGHINDGGVVFTVQNSHLAVCLISPTLRGIA